MADVYANPGKELKRLAESGHVVRLAHGVYMAVPPQYVGSSWFPPAHLGAIAWATAVYGPEVPILAGVSAARLYHAIPREVALAEVLVPVSRRPAHLDDGTTVRLSSSGYKSVQWKSVRTELGYCRATTPSQTFNGLRHAVEQGANFASVIESDIEQAIDILDAMEVEG